MSMVQKQAERVGIGGARRARRVLLAIGSVGVMALAACGAPGASSSSTDGNTTTAANSGAQGSGSSTPAGSSTGGSSTKAAWETEPITLQIILSTGEEETYVQKTSAAFTKLHPNVTFNIVAQDFTSLVQNAQHLISGSDIPDMIQLANYGRMVKDGLLTNLDPYAAEYGWDKWDSQVFAGLSMANNGTELGSGSLYGIGHGANVTGVFYNKANLKKAGITELPTTLAQLEADFQKAKDAGMVPLVVNGKDGLLTYPLQNLAADYAGSVSGIQDWIYQKQGASIQNDSWVQAATTLREWMTKGYLSPNTVSLDQTDAVNQFASGQGAFYLTGTWSAPTFDAAKGQEFGFFPFPPKQAGGVVAAMTAQNIYSIPSGAKHKDAMAAYFNYILTDPEARQMTYDICGTIPPVIPGAPDLKVATGTSQAEAVDAMATVSKAGGLMGFMANATQSMFTTLFPDTQLLAAGRMAPAAFVTQVQSDYESGLTKN